MKRSFISWREPFHLITNQLRHCDKATNFYIINKINKLKKSLKYYVAMSQYLLTFTSFFYII